MQRNPIEELLRQQSSRATKTPGAGMGIAVGVIFLFVGAFLLVGGSGGGLFLVVIGIVSIASAIQSDKVKRAEQAQPPLRQSQPVMAQPKRAEPKCDNPEPHRHYTPETVDSQTKRRESLQHLFEAGLLTREEYADMVRRGK